MKVSERLVRKEIALQEEMAKTSPIMEQYAWGQVKALENVLNGDFYEVEE